MKGILSLMALAGFSAGTVRAQWSQLGSTGNSIINVMEEHNGSLFFAGNFTQFNGTSSYFSMRYNGTAFTYYGTLVGGTGFMCLGVHDNVLYGGGGIMDGSMIGVGVWSGSAWTAGPYYVNNTVNVNALQSFGGNLIVGGAFTDPFDRIAQHNGTSYAAMGAGFDGTVNDLAVYNGELYACGNITNSGSTAVGYIARWTGTAWVNVGSGLNGYASEMEVYAGSLYVIGSFTTAGGASAQHIARWNGTAWSALGSGIPYTLGGSVSSLKAIPSGLMVGGEFTDAGGTTVQNIALWDGTTFSDPGPLPVDERVIDIEYFQSKVFITTYVGGVGAYSKIYTNSSVGVAEASPFDDLYIFPVPAIGELNIAGEVGSMARYRIMDAAGRCRQSGQAQTRLDLGGLSPGYYVLELVNGAALRRVPFVVAR